MVAILTGHDHHVAHAIWTSGLVVTLVGFALPAAGGTTGGAISYVHGMRVLGLPEEPTRRAIVPRSHPEKEEAAQ